jgi:hypothetical protein
MEKSESIAIINLYFEKLSQAHLKQKPKKRIADHIDKMAAK